MSFTGNYRFEVELKKRIGAEIERLQDELSAGMLKDFAQYQNYCGQVAALKRVTDEYCSEVEKKLNEG